MEEFNLENTKPDVRHLNDMKEVIYDKEWAKTAPNLELYYMYRGMKHNNELRYDITIIPSKMLGKEFIKTVGHEHVGNHGELYIVLEGKAIYLMQKRNGKNIEDVFAVEAKKGDVVAIPSGYGHFTINPSKKILKMSNWLNVTVKANYSPIKKLGGACYFYTTDGWVKNTNYSKVPELRFKKAQRSFPEDLNFLR